MNDPARPCPTVQANSPSNHALQFAVALKNRANHFGGAALFATSRRVGETEAFVAEA